VDLVSGCGDADRRGADRWPGDRRRDDHDDDDRHRTAVVQQLDVKHLDDDRDNDRVHPVLDGQLHGHDVVELELGFNFFHAAADDVDDHLDHVHVGVGRREAPPPRWPRR
jgi:hypothetical protein